MAKPRTVRDDPLDLNLRTIKVNQQTDWQTGGTQIIQALRGMYIFEQFYCLEFNKHYVCYKQICKELTDNESIIFNHNWMLGFHIQSRFANFDHTSILINFFQK